MRNALLVFAIVLLLAVNLQADVQTYSNLSAIGDSFVALFYPDSNFGADNYISLSPGSYGDTTGNSWCGLFEWNLGLRPGETVQSFGSANVTLFQANLDTGTKIRFYRLTSSFVEGSVTWNNRPPIDSSTYVDYYASSDNHYKAITVDVSSLFANNGNMGTFGIACEFYPTESYPGGSDNAFFSKEMAWPSYGNTSLLTASLTSNMAAAPTPNRSMSDVAATDDSYVLDNAGGGYADLNVGSEPYIYTMPGLYTQAVGTSWVSCGLWQWDLAYRVGDLVDYVSNASVSLFVNSPPSGTTYRFYRLTAPFDESTVTWNNRPSCDSSTYVEWTSAGEARTPVTIDVTPLLQNNGNLTTFGVVAQQTSGGECNTWFSKENTGWPSYGVAAQLSASYHAVPTDPVKYSDTVTIDGNLADWADADWKPLDKVYDGAPTDISEGAWAVRWGAGGARVYAAVKVQDTSHYLTSEWTYWNGQDDVELYLHTTGTDTGPYGTNVYGQYQEQAQQWAAGIISSSGSAVWLDNGYPTNYGHYTPTSDECVGAGSVDGDWLYYEIAMTPFEYFGGRRGYSNIVSPLHSGDTIGFDVDVASCDADGYYTGMKCNSASINGLSGNYNYFWQHVLVRSGVQGAVTLTGHTGSLLGTAVTIMALNGSGSAIETHNAILDGSGTYSFNTDLSGTYTLKAEATGYLPQSKSVIIIGGIATGVDFVLSTATASPIADVKKLQLGGTVMVEGAITAAFDGSIYIESTERASGIRVDKQSHGYTSSDFGKVVDVTGTLSKDSSTQELYIDASSISATEGTESILPLGMVNKSVCGGGFVDAGTGYGQIGTTDGTGLNNIGLLIKTTGDASNGDANGFDIADGSNIPVKVLLSGAGTTYNGRYVAVIGISSIDSSGNRVIKARSSSDIKIIQ